MSGKRPWKSDPSLTFCPMSTLINTHPWHVIRPLFKRFHWKWNRCADHLRQHFQLGFNKMWLGDLWDCNWGGGLNFTQCTMLALTMLGIFTCYNSAAGLPLCSSCNCKKKFTFYRRKELYCKVLIFFCNFYAEVCCDLNIIPSVPSG